MQREVRIFDGPGDVARAGAERFLAAARSAEGRFDVTLAGGSTPKAMHVELAARAKEVDWSRVHVWFGDERCVPADHADSNYKMAFDTLLSRVPIAPERVHRMRGELPPEEGARAYDQEIAGVTLALTFLGMGPDGHTASLFPGHAALAEQKRRAIAVYETSKPPPWRITLTVPALSASDEVVILVAGVEKADAAMRALQGPPGAVPIALIRAAKRVTWLLDRAAASALAGKK